MYEKEIGSIQTTRGLREPQPAEPTILGRANELLNHISTLEQHSASLRGDIFGDSENQLKKSDDPTTLNAMLAVACERVASLCGEMATVRDRLGGRRNQ